ncbi:Ribose ABC transport system, ATP-binding protein RbsA [Rubellimicrobium mesophilum DSM 19309]|uniref:Ribose ABC transport system, ATP-binding protein RbsA n=1 Tax=Rubellimicrobium mesophilum DSM 19309 TaxID=442562 RepID=A0A017HV15_9RHOB|nr:sugar ABC transporter ATP-binding protein [Rubellimicrobium mesophilum]EYD78236.1 Ribose ABC transport system, ATP-binding protein RbsA [Rubellimicrobium mesophilum DSM 19309]
MTEHPIGLTIRGGTKVYPGTRALKDVDFDLRMGAVNVLVGENGAGKSTLMKVIAGVEELTEGRIEMDGQPVRFRSTREAERHGIGIVFQELNLFPNMSVADNIFIAHEKTRVGVDIDAGAQREAAGRLMERLEQDIDPDTPVGDLRIGQQQIVEIAKSLARDARILILDEPTSALSATEVEVLFRVIADLKAHGVGIVYISHRLEELIRIGDYITVLRDGVITGARAMAGVDVPWIVRNMIGDASKDFPREGAAQFGPEVLRAEEVCLPRQGGGWLVDHVSLSVREGEIVGIYGLMGAGRTELLDCIMGQHPHATGRVFIGGEALVGDVAGRIRRGVALIPEDRKRDGLIGTMAIRENLTLSSLRDFTRAGRLDLKAEARKAIDFVKRLGIKAASVENPVFSLSGGNQQKVVIGKALMTQPRVLLMDEPSRGIDIGAKAEVFRVMRQLSAQGLGIVFVTSDLDEVLSLSDRIVVMANGRISASFEAREADAARVARAAAPTQLEDAA